MGRGGGLVITQVDCKSKKFIPLCCISILLLLLGNAHSADFSASGKNWKASLSASYIYDDNVTQRPDIGSLAPAGLPDQEDSIFNWSGSASYKLGLMKNFDMTMDYDIDMSLHADLDQYDLTAQMFGINPVYRFSRFARFSFRNWFMYNRVDGDDFSTVYMFDPSFSYMHPTFGYSRVHYTFNHTNNMVNDLRDSKRNAVGFDQVFFFSNFKHYFGVGYEHAIEDTQGLAYDRDINIWAFKFKASLPYNLSLYGKYKVTFRDYDNRLATSLTKLRDDDLHDFKFKLKWLLIHDRAILKKVTAKLEYQHTSNDSNLRLRDYTVDRVILGFEAKY